MFVLLILPFSVAFIFFSSRFSKLMNFPDRTGLTITITRKIKLWPPPILTTINFTTEIGVHKSIWRDQCIMLNIQKIGKPSLDFDAEWCVILAINVSKGNIITNLVYQNLLKTSNQTILRLNKKIAKGFWNTQ